MTESEIDLEKKILAKLEDLEAKTTQKRKDWFSAPMIMAYVAILGLFGTTAENVFNRIKESKQDVLEVETQGELTSAFVEKLDEIASNHKLQFDAIIYAMSSSQKRKVDKYIEANGKVETASASSNVGGGSDAVFGLIHPDVLFSEGATEVESAADETEDKPEEIKPKKPEGIFQQLQIKVKDGESLDFDKVRAAVQDKKRSM